MTLSDTLALSFSAIDRGGLVMADHLVVPDLLNGFYRLQTILRVRRARGTLPRAARRGLDLGQDHYRALLLLVGPRGSPPRRCSVCWGRSSGWSRPSR